MTKTDNNQFGFAPFLFQAEGQAQGEGQGQGQGQGEDQGQGQDQLNAQANLQGQGELQGQGQLNAQANLQGQGETQGQGQGENQGQSQTSEQHSVNANGNGNLDLNGNGNGNGNLNGNGNFNGNLNANEAHNGLQNSDVNANANLSANGVQNTVDNDVNNHVNVCVNVDANVDASGHLPTEAGVLHMDGLSIGSLDGSFLVMPDFGSQSLTGDGNNFHLDQVNNLVSNGQVSGVSDGLMVSSGDGGFPPFGTEDFLGSQHGGGSGSPFSFAQNATTYGGTASDGGNAVTGDHGSLTGSANAAATVTQEAFTQHIVLGSNIQYNTMPISVVGGDSYADGAHDIGHH